MDFATTPSHATARRADALITDLNSDMADNLHDDEFVANLLKQDAKSATKKYELVGIDAFNPRRYAQS